MLLFPQRPSRNGFRFTNSRYLRRGSGHDAGREYSVLYFCLSCTVYCIFVSLSTVLGDKKTVHERQKFCLSSKQGQVNWYIAARWAGTPAEGGEGKARGQTSVVIKSEPILRMAKQRRYREKTSDLISVRSYPEHLCCRATGSTTVLHAPVVLPVARLLAAAIISSAHLSCRPSCSRCNWCHH